MGGARRAYGERRHAHRVLVGQHEGERDHLDGPGVNGRIILKRIFAGRGMGRHGLN